MKTVEVNEDDYGVVQVIKAELGISEKEALTLIVEITLGLMITVNDEPFVRKITTDKLYDLLKQEKYRMLIERLKQIWSM